MSFRRVFPWRSLSHFARSKSAFTYIKIVVLTSVFWILVDALAVFYVTSNPSTTSAHISQPIKETHKTEVNLVKKELPVKTFTNVLGSYFERDLHPPPEPGEQGAGVKVDKHLKDKEKELFKINQFNLMVSDMISVNRSLRDYRNQKCEHKEYSVDLPTTSVIIIFHNEAWSTLIRTIMSVINRSPRQLVAEIILVDDASEREFLKTKLEEFLAEVHYPIRLIRLSQRTGLIRARLAGADVAKGDVLTFLDSHCECTRGWLEPLLAEIQKDSSTVVTPVIDNVDLNDFHYGSMKDNVQVGGFTWSLTFYWYQIPASERQRLAGDHSLPVRSPTMAGGLFSIDRKYFEHIGRYDDQMDVWGGENVEISFRIWQCGGSLYIVPCSHVGHVFRKSSPYTWPGGVGNILVKNNRRLAEVWMDEYKHFWFFISPNAKHVNYGDVSERLALRANLKCKNFNWYIKNIWPESSYNLDVFYIGQIRNRQNSKCADTMGRKDSGQVGMTGCHGQGGNQAFAFTKRNEIRSDDFCLDASGANSKVILFRCHFQGGNQHWTYDHGDSYAFRHTSTSQCLDMDSSGSGLVIRTCSSASSSQKWDMKNAANLDALLKHYRI